MPINTVRTLNISNFVSQVSKSGFSRLNRIAIRINPPFEVAKQLKFMDVNSTVTYYAESVTMPGVELLTNELYLNGPPVTYPIKSDFKPGAMISFLVDDSMNQRKLFDTWLNFINPKEKDFDFRYRDDYIGKVTIFQINETGDDISYAVELQEAYPIRIGDVRGTWAEQEVVRLDVELSYRYWRNLSRGEIIGDLDQLIGVTVTGTRKSRDDIAGVIVTGTKKNDEIQSVTVTGTRR